MLLEYPLGSRSSQVGIILIWELVSRVFLTCVREEGVLAIRISYPVL